MNKLKLGIAGLNRGKAYLDNIKYCFNAEITAICDINENLLKERAEKYGINKAYHTFEELIESDVDAVVVATPIDKHAEHVIKALKAGKHVLSEVIIATTAKDCKKIAAEVQKTDKVYMMAENYCYITPMTIVKNMARAGLFGDIYYAEADYLKDFQEYNPNFPNVGGWRQETYFGRKGHPYITHSLGPLSYIMEDKVKSVYCEGAGHSFDMVADNTCTLMCRTEKGAVIRLRNSFVSPRPDNFTYYSIQGTKGCYQAPSGDTDFHKVHIQGICKPSEWKNVYEFMDYMPEAVKKLYPDISPDTKDNDTYKMYDTGISVMIDEFSRCVLTGEKLPFDFYDSANWTLTGIMSGVSVEKGVPIDIPAL